MTEGPEKKNPLEQGAQLTRQFVFEGDRLYLNLNADFGWAQVEVLNDEMEPIPCFARAD